MVDIWYIVYIVIALMCFLLIPYASYYYETDDEKPWTTRFWTAFQFTLCTFIIIGICIFIGFTFFHTAEIPVTACTRNVASFESSTSELSTVTVDSDMA